MLPGAVLVVGIDVGTQGVRVLVVDESGALHARATDGFPTWLDEAAGIAEQDSAAWWDAVCRCLRAVTREVDASRIVGLAVTSTSGTIVLVGADDRPLRPALMYGDTRAAAEARELAVALRGRAVNPADPAAKLLWLQRHEPDTFARVTTIAHAADFIAARLTGEWATDWSHALKSGYDPARLQWSSILGAVSLAPEQFARVVPPGTEIGRVTTAASSATGLARATRVFAGMTDGCASQISAGAVSPGRWSTTIGTTLVVKGVTRERLEDPLGRVYNHRHPEGSWMPGGASNTGGECLQREFAGEDLPRLDRQAAELTPTGLVAYPLMRQGERFPFSALQAHGFLLGTAQSRAERYAAYLEGVALLERLAYATLAHLGAAVEGAIATSGGAARSEVWMQIRADVLDRPLRRPELPEAAAGAAIIAAAAILGETVSKRASAMVRMVREVSPRGDFVERYLESYERFVQALGARGYLNEEM